MMIFIFSRMMSAVSTAYRPIGITVKKSKQSRLENKEWKFYLVAAMWSDNGWVGPYYEEWINTDFEVGVE